MAPEECRWGLSPSLRMHSHRLLHHHFLRFFFTFHVCVGGIYYESFHQLITMSSNESICLCKVRPAWEDRRNPAFLMPSQALARSPGPRCSESPHFKVRTRHLHSSLGKPDRMVLPCSPALVNTEISVFPPRHGPMLPRPLETSGNPQTAS